MARPLRLAVIGAGRMAHRRLGALMATGDVALCGVAASRTDTATSLADGYGGGLVTADYHDLAVTRPDAVLVEVPHDVQDDAVRWAIGQGSHVLVGGPLATTGAAARTIAAAADARGLVIEAGFEARYQPVWETARALVASGRLGELTCGAAVALWPADPASWYYSEARSGGMPLTHMTYCFVNPLRWLFGEPLGVRAIGHRRSAVPDDAVRTETCVALLGFDALSVGLTAGYVRASAERSWEVRLFGDRAVLDILPDEDGPGRLRLLFDDRCEAIEFEAGDDAFHRQAAAFVGAIRGGEAVRNPPSACIGDLDVVEAIDAAIEAFRDLQPSPDRRSAPADGATPLDVSKWRASG